MDAALVIKTTDGFIVLPAPSPSPEGAALDLGTARIATSLSGYSGPTVAAALTALFDKEAA